MSARLTRSNVCWLLLTLGVSFAVAACAAGGGQPEGTRPPRQPARTSGESPPATPPAATEQAPRTGRDRTPLGDVAEIRRPWVQVRSAPNENARAIALVFGNDKLTVVDKQGDWMRVRIDGGREGWIPESATESP